MKNRWTRREFLGVTVVTTASIGAAGIDPLGLRSGIREDSTALPPLETDVQKLSRAVMDEIIPGTDGMPAASQARCGEYLERLWTLEPQLRQKFDEAIAAVDRLSQERFQKRFVQLAQEERLRVLNEMEAKAAPDLFDILRDHTYEAYYMQPEVQKRIGYEFYPFQKPIPLIKPFEEAVLAKVRKMPKIFREAK